MNTPALSGSRWPELLVRRAARWIPGSLATRLEEEWLAHLLDRQCGWMRLRFAFGCCWAALAVRQEGLLAHEAASPAYRSYAAHPGRAIHQHQRQQRPQRPLWAPVGTEAVLCAINTTPLIDVMLVLVVTLIFSLPIMTHAVKLELPVGTAQRIAERPAVIDLSVDFDGTLAWNGVPVGGLEQLEHRLAVARLAADCRPFGGLASSPNRRKVGQGTSWCDTQGASDPWNHR